MPLFPSATSPLRPNRASGRHIPELDRVLGGGIVPGSVVLIGGDPGIGKSTLMMQLASAVQGITTLYITGEESASQIRLRAERLDPHPSDRVLLLAETDLQVIACCARRYAPLISSSWIPCRRCTIRSWRARRGR